MILVSNLSLCINSAIPWSGRAFWDHLQFIVFFSQWPLTWPHEDNTCAPGDAGGQHMSWGHTPTDGGRSFDRAQVKSWLNGQNGLFHPAGIAETTILVRLNPCRVTARSSYNGFTKLEGASCVISVTWPPGDSLLRRIDFTPSMDK